jgi:transposase
VEEGGLNLYCILQNQTISRFDVLGLKGLGPLLPATILFWLLQELGIVNYNDSEPTEYIVIHLDVVPHCAILRGMTPYSIDLRERIVAFVSKGNSKAEAARHFDVCRKTVTRYCQAAQCGDLAPKPCGGSAKTFSDDALRREVRDNPSATLKSHGKALGVSHNAVWKRLRQLAIKLKKNA